MDADHCLNSSRSPEFSGFPCSLWVIFSGPFKRVACRLPTPEPQRLCFELRR